MTVGAIILAAGSGSRFAASGGRGPKQLAAVDGRAMVTRVVEAALGASLDEVVVVEGSVGLRDELSACVGEVVVIDNPSWSDGLATSLHAGISHARERGHDAVVVGLADQPGVMSEAWSAVAAAAPVPPIAVATYGGRRGNPVRLHETVWDLVPTSGDTGARQLMGQRPDLVAEVPCAGDPRDIDTREDLEAWT